MTQQNSLAPFVKATAEELLESIGVTQFIGEGNWYQVIAGLIIQGGKLTSVATGTLVTFNTSFTRQTLNVIITPVAGAVISTAVNTVSVDDFVLVHNSGGASDFYWFAIGV